MQILVIDIGGTNVKILASGHETPRKLPSGPTMTPEAMVEGVRELAKDWNYAVVSIGYPGPVINGQIMKEPHNLAPGWVGFNFEAAFGRPVRLVNDAAMQALGSYQGGKILFLGLGTGLGTAFVADGQLLPMELGHLPYRKGTFEDYVGIRGIEERGKRKWREHVFQVVAILSAALLPDEVVLGGGNTAKLKELPPNCRRGNNANAYLGGYALWESPAAQVSAGVAAAQAGGE